MEKLVEKLEAILFYLAEPVDVSFLAKTLDVSKKEIMKAIGELGVSLEKRGLRIVLHDDEVTLVTAPEFGDLIEKIVKEERERDLGRAGIETLSIIAYKGPVSKKEIEYIRGVNSQYALRNLLLRGLVEKKTSQTDERVIVYTVTSDTLRYLGLSHITELPEYDEVNKQIEVEVNPENLENTEDQDGE
jgi:segregation and condensation protein B